MNPEAGPWTNEYNRLKAELLARTMGVKPSVFPYVEECPDCMGTGVHLYNPDYPMGDCGAREEEPCLTCNERGWLIPPSWTGPSGTSASARDGGGSSDHSVIPGHGSLNT